MAYKDTVRGVRVRLKELRKMKKERTLNEKELEELKELELKNEARKLANKLVRDAELEGKIKKGRLVSKD
ncbi:MULTISPECIES: hypothetical protein [Bacillus]|uniref:hypothetical protein n=1 Tax=Bacillus TaxID=1386 RepID=UPI0001A0BA1F|nr:MULTISPECIES: hypothetical protein [Bacillus cereus group]EEL32886.1 hypothetical protein bcere0019_39390 [Bacillus cereus Rock3-28]EOP22450.1 hypothetical protein IIS_03417 [Bacillus cereus VD131]MBJ8038730.1 hypothetical protein [Bacillus cereus group sp. N17]MCU5302957.1 hypothetical protein [Bacillus toyonensis]MCU5726781.1 hypothetical protein [Bacillus toyonensis]